MSFIGNLISARMIRLNNNRRNHLSTRIIDFISTDGMLVLCGGRKGEYNNRGEYVLSLAEEYKLETFFCASEDAQRRNQGAVCFYAVNNLLKPDISRTRLASDYISFGENVSYSPLITTDCDIQSAYSFFDRLVQFYCRQNHRENYDVICGMINMLLHIIDESMGSEYLTLNNIGLLADRLIADNIVEFQEDVKRISGRPFLRNWENYLILSWDNSVQLFHEFWKRFRLSISHCKAADSREESLYTVIMDRKACFCPIGAEDAFLKEIMLSELEMIHGSTYGYKLVDYYVPLENAENYRCVTEGLCCLIGDSFRSMGIRNCSFADPAVICLGVNAGDARDILDAMAAAGTWTQTYLGFEPVSLHFNSIDRRPVTERDLSLQQIRDGSAYRLDNRGFTRIISLFV